jgi:hypothetical protein
MPVDVPFEESTMSSIPVPRRRRFLIRFGIVVAVLAVPVYLLAVAIEHVQEAAERVHCNLGGVSLAFYNYQDAHRGLPPAVVYDKDGKPLYSWRVLLLPYIEANDLYKDFKLDEAWDSPHNLALLPRMPKSYAPPGRQAARVPPYHTTLHVFVGPGTAFEDLRERTFQPQKSLKIPDDFPDGPSNTILFVEAGEPVPWTKPEELFYDPEGPLPDLRSFFRHGFRACTVDCSYRFVRKETPEATLRAYITRNGGEPADLYRLP